MMGVTERTEALLMLLTRTLAKSVEAHNATAQERVAALGATATLMGMILRGLIHEVESGPGTAEEHAEGVESLRAVAREHIKAGAQGMEMRL